MNLKREAPAKLVERQSGFDKFLLRVAPKIAATREHYRLRYAANKRAYEAIELTRLRRERNDARSADQVNSVAVDRLRYQARSLDENHDLARSVLNTLVANIVGTGLLTFPMVKDRNGNLLEEANAALTKLWLDWSKRPEVTQEHNWQKVQQLAVRSWFRDGEVFANMLRGTVPDLNHGSAVAFSIEQMEGDFCPLGFNNASSGIRQGIKKSIWGEPQSYFFFKDYPTEGPGDSIFLGLSGMSSFSVALTDLNEKAAENILHLKHVDRIRQTRGVSLFASFFARLDDLKEYEESERVAARIGAAFAFAITKGIDTPGVLPSSGDTFREMDLAPGIIADTLQPGEKVESLKNERPDNKITEFRKNQLKAVAGGANAGYSELARDFEGSYSSQRQELVSMARVYKAIRGEFVNVYVQPIWQNFVNMAFAQGLIDLRSADPLTMFDAQHLGLGTPYIEPQRETEAAIKRVQGGFTSRTQEILERGDDPREVQRTIIKERANDAEANLLFSTDFAATMVGADSGPGDDTGQPNDVNDDDDNADDEDRILKLVDDYEIGSIYRGANGENFEYTVDGFKPYSGGVVNI
jgi:lambda family phage portal protein